MREALVAGTIIATLLTAGCGSTVQVAGFTGPAAGSGQERAPDQPSGIGGSTRVPSVGLTDAQRPGAGSAPAAGDAQAQVQRPPAIQRGQVDRSASTQRLPSISGPGWDARRIYVGIPTEEDVHQYAGTLGISFDPGSVRADAQAVIDDVNRRGGLFGRQLLPLFRDNATSDLSSNPEGAAQSNCTFFTQDHRVIAVLNALPLLDTANFRSCLKQRRTPLVSMASTLDDDETYGRSGSYFWSTLEPNLDRLVPGWIGRLQAQGYFKAWNTSAGSPGTAPTKVGILEPDTPQGKRLSASIKAQLGRIGITKISEYHYEENLAAYGRDMSSAQLSFASSGVTHVLNIPPIAASWLVFMQTAEQQRYRPRYGLTSYSVLSAAQDNAPAAQLAGSIGSGWFPGVDVDTANDPGSTPAQARCRVIQAKAGQTFSGDNRRTALAFAYALCDALHLLVDGAKAGGGLDGSALSAGFAQLGDAFKPAATFKNALGTTNRALPGTTRDVGYEQPCACFRYHGSPHPI